MKVLFIGGTGVISSACTEMAIRSGWEVYLLHRGSEPKIHPPAEVRHFIADIRKNPEEVASWLDWHNFDVIVDWIVYTPEDAQRDVELFRGRAGQFVFISSAAAYQRPVQHYLIREDTPLANPYWEYARLKIACEGLFMNAYRDSGFPVTIVRPSYTYGPTSFPLCVNSREHPYTVADRIRRGKDIIVPGDGTSLWTLTYHTDFAAGLIGLLGYSPAVGHSFHITSDEVLTWDQIYGELGSALGREPRLVHLPSDLIAAAEPQRYGSLIGDKSCSVVFDNSKIKKFVPGFQPKVNWAGGVRRILDWYHADPRRCTVDEPAEARWDRLLTLYRRCLQDAGNLTDAEKTCS